jgi:hypothetical protein
VLLQPSLLSVLLPLPVSFRLNLPWLKIPKR